MKLTYKAILITGGGQYEQNPGPQEQAGIIQYDLIMSGPTLG
jgi:hypothetical protein